MNKNMVLSILSEHWFPSIIAIVTMIVAIGAIIVMWYLTHKQINAMRKIEEDKRMIAIESLLNELMQNKNWVNQFLHDSSEEGGHSGKKLSEQIIQYSWVWNPPQLVAYQNYFSIVCSKDKQFAKEIINLYSRLESCKVIVYFIHELLIHSAEAGIIKYNEQIKNICSEIQNSFDGPINKLKAMVSHSDFDETEFMATTSCFPLCPVTPSASSSTISLSKLTGAGAKNNSGAGKNSVRTP